MKVFTVFSCLVPMMITAFPTKFFGEWVLWHSTNPNIPDNRVIIHIYPDNLISLKYRFMRGPFVYHKSKIGNFEIIDNTGDLQRVDVNFHHKEEKFLSVYGIGFQNMNIKTLKKNINHTFKLSATFVGMDDIYLHSHSSTDDDECFHIVRSVRVNEPAVDIPLSTFVITQIIGTILGHLINQWVFQDING